jgi:hypothetical protein
MFTDNTQAAKAKLRERLDKTLGQIGLAWASDVKLKLRYGYLAPASSETLHTIMPNVDGSNINLHIGTWYGAAYNVIGGWNKFRQPTSRTYREMYARVRKTRGREASAEWKGRSYRPFMRDAVKDSLGTFEGIIMKYMYV